MSEFIIEIPDEYFASYDTERDMYYPDERDSAMSITPIVRCVDCAYFKSETDKFPALCRLWLPRNLSKQYGIEPDGFCAWGERVE